MKQILTLARNEIFNLYIYTLFNQINSNPHVKFLFRKTLMEKILIIRKYKKNFFLIFQALESNTLFCFSDSTVVSHHQEKGSPIHPNVDPTAYDLIMLEVDDILPSPLTPLVLAPTVPEPVCEMQTPALFTTAQSSPQPQSVDTANYARVNPLPSPATSSSSSSQSTCRLSDTSSPSVPVGTHSLSHEPLLQGSSQVPQPPSSFSITHTAISTAQPPPQQTQQTSISSWADDVEQSGTSTPETVNPNWAFSDRVRRPRPRSQPLVYPPPIMSTPHPQRPPVISPRYGPTIPPLRLQQSFLQPPNFD